MKITKSLIAVCVIAFPSLSFASPLKQSFERIYPTESVISTTSKSVTLPWPTSSPVIRPGVLEINGKRYEFAASNAGLISYLAFDPKFVFPTVIYEPYFSGANLIVYDPGSTNIYNFVGSIGKLIGYGTSDINLTNAQLKVLMRQRLVWVQCGATSELVVSLMADQNIQARRIHLLTKATAATASNFDDGHVVVEIKDGANWKLFDVSLDSYFTNGTNHLSALQLFDFGMPNATTIRLAPTEVSGGDIGPNTLISSTPYPPRYKVWFQFRAYWDQVCSTPAKEKAWRERIYQVFGWPHPTNGEIWYLNEGLNAEQCSWVTSLSSAYKLKTRAQIIAQFYQ